MLDRFCSAASALPVVLGLLIVAIAGCASTQDRALNESKIPLEKRAHNHTRAATRPSSEVPDADGTFVAVAISGGGSRSANFSAAMLFELQRAGILQKVDYISSVSGGSLTAAYYCTSNEDWNPETAQKKLTHNFADEALWRLLLPWNFFGLMFTDLDRTDLLARSFQNNLFTKDGKDMTFADLRAERPRLLINSTDLQSGDRFVFCNETFDELNSNLDKYPIAYAVAASSAVPVVLHPVTLRDYSTTFPQYRHLIDGGITDNLGVRTLVDVYRHHIWNAKSAGRPDPYPNGAIFLVIDARTKFDSKIAERSDIGIIESLKAGTGLSSSVLLERASAATLSDIIVDNITGSVKADEVRDLLNTMSRTGYLQLSDKYDHNVSVIHLALSRVNELTNVPFTSFWASVNSIATYFNITDSEAYQLYQSAELLVRQKYQARLQEISDRLNKPVPANAR
jgi:predicted acylesterase/phospholipase RssA